jgi:hypothetical protein
MITTRFRVSRHASLLQSMADTYAATLNAASAVWGVASPITLVTASSRMQRNLYRLWGLG